MTGASRRSTAGRMGDGSAGEGRPALVVMARPLVSGAVKTRLAGTLGDDDALAVYADLLRGTLDQAELLDGVDLVLASSEAPAGDDAAGATGATDPLAARSPRWRRLAQRGDELGERLAGVFADLFAAGASAVVAVNSDSPPIPLAYLRQAVSRAEAGRLVVGPAADGGYYLIGCGRATWARHRAGLAELLRTSPMSTPRLLDHTLRGAAALGLEAAQLPLWLDVDEADQLAVLERLLGAAPLRGEPLAGLREVYLHLTHRCGRACLHCYDNDGSRAGDELTTAEWRDAIDQCVSLGATSFVFIGGDPLLRSDFDDLVGHITGAHRARARFFFNSLITPEAAARLAHAGHGRLTPLASVDGPRPVNDALRGPGSYDEVMSSVAHLLDAGLEPVANIVLVRPVLAGLAQLARELRAAGVRRLHLILPHQQGVVDDLALVPPGAELLAAVRALVEVAGEIGLAVDNLPSWRRRLGRRNDLCAAGCRDLAVDPYGNVHACVITAGDPAFVAGSLREQPLEQIWRESPSLRLLRASRARDRADCRKCPVVDVCGGECWVQAHYAARARGEAAGYAAPFPYCELVRPMLEELRAAEAAAEMAAQAAADAAAGVGAGVAAGACGGQAAAGEDAYSLFDCI